MLIAILVVLVLTGVLQLSLLWTRVSPTRSSSPTPTSDDSATSLIPTISEMFVDLQRETTNLVVTLIQGRESQPPTMPTETELTESVRPNVSDFDTGPTSPGIEAVEQREAEEALLEASLRERRVFQERMREVERLEQEKLQILSDLEQSSPGPWNGQAVDHDLT